VSVRLSVCPVVRQQQRRAAGLLLVAQWAGDVDAQDAQQQSCAYWFTSAFRGPPPPSAICPVASAESRRRLRSASSTDLIVPATRRTTMGAGPRLRRRSTARPEQSAGRDPSQLISGHLQTLSENLLIARVFINIVFITFSPRAVNIVKCPP